MLSTVNKIKAAFYRFNAGTSQLIDSALVQSTSIIDSIE